MEALIVISVISIVVFLVARANRKDKKDREIPDVKPPVVVPPIPDPETTPEPEVPIAPEPTEPEIERNIIAEFEPYTGTPVKIPATEDTSFVDKDGNQVPFTIRVPLLLKNDSDNIILSKSDRNIGGEWMLRAFRGKLELTVTTNSSDVNKMANIDLEGLPKNELFVLVITGDLAIPTNEVKIHLNAVPKRTGHRGAGLFYGLEKTDTPIYLGSNGWNNEKADVETGKIIIEKGRAWSYDEIVKDYEYFFGIESIIAKPNADGNFIIPVEPNTGDDKADELLSSFRNIPNGEENPSKIIVKEGKYLVDMIGSQSHSAIDLYTKKGFDIDFNNAVLYTTQPSILDVSVIAVGKRLQLNVEEAEDISVRNLNVEGSLRQDTYEKGLAFEHGISNEHSDNLVYENIVVKNVWGDGMYFDRCKNVTLKNIVTDGTNRQGIGVGGGVHNLKINNYLALNCIRASLDLEGDFLQYTIDGVELTNSELWAHIAAAGTGRVNNVNIHHNIHFPTIIMKGNRFKRGEDNELIPLPPRENWVIEDNKYVGGFGSPVAMVRISVCKDVKINRNEFVVPTSQGRFANDITYCSGRIEVMNNTYDNPSITRILKCEKGTEVIIDEPNTDNVYAIEIEGEPLKLIGTNMELLPKIFARDIDFLGLLLLGEVEVIEEIITKYPKLLENAELPDWDSTLDVYSMAEIISKDKHVLHYFFYSRDEEEMKFVLENHSNLLNKFDRK